MDAGLGQQALRVSFLEDMGPISKFVQRARLLEVKATVSLYDVFNRISGKTGRAMWPKGFSSAIASCNATVTFFHGHADGVTRELTWCSVSFEAKIRDFCDGTQVVNFLLKLEFLDESTTGSSQSTEDICGKFSETEPPSATLSPRD